MAKKFLLIKKVRGYVTKPDRSASPEDSLVEMSQNVLINDQEKVAIRPGYELFGAASTALYDIKSEKVWQTSSGDEIMLRSLNDEIQFYDEFSDAWIVLKDSFTAVDFCFATWWDTSENIDLLLFVNGADKIWDWSGAITTLASTTVNTITKSGTTSWAQERFLTAGTRKVVINGNEYEYTGGETTTTLTGLLTDPTGEVAGSTVFQSIRENDNEPANNAVNDVISVLNNQLYVGSNESKEVYISKDTDFKDFAFSSPRATGEGALLVLDNITRGFARKDNEMWIGSGRDDWYKAEFESLEISGGLIIETCKVKKIKTQPGLAPQSQNLICELGDSIVYVSFEPAVRILGTIEELENQIRTLSNPIKPDIDAEDFTGGHIMFYQNRVYISAPPNNKVYINEIREDENGVLERFWQPPQILPVGKFSIYSGILYGHSSMNSETYKLFTGTSDNGKSISAIAAFAYRSYGRRDVCKIFEEWMTEGYISFNTKLILTLRYDYGGATQELEAEIDGSDEGLLFQPTISGSLGSQTLGMQSLGDILTEIEPLSKFRIFNQFVPQDFFEIQAIYSTNDIDYQWQILSHGGNVRITTTQPVKLKR